MQVSAGLSFQMIVLQQFCLVLKQLLLAKTPSFYCVYDSLHTKANPFALRRIWHSGARRGIHLCTKLRILTPGGYKAVQLQHGWSYPDLWGSGRAFRHQSDIPGYTLDACGLAEGEDSCHPSAKLPPQSREQIPFVRARAATKNNHIHLQHCPSNIASAIAIIPTAGKFWLNYLTSQYLELELKAIESIELFFPNPIKLWS